MYFIYFSMQESCLHISQCLIVCAMINRAVAEFNWQRNNMPSIQDLNYVFNKRRWLSFPPSPQFTSLYLTAAVRNTEWGVESTTQVSVRTNTPSTCCNGHLLWLLCARERLSKVFRQCLVNLTKEIKRREARIVAIYISSSSSH